MVIKYHIIAQVFFEKAFPSRGSLQKTTHLAVKITSAGGKNLTQNKSFYAAAINAQKHQKTNNYTSNKTVLK